MALRMGVGDVFTLCKGAVDLCSKAIHEEREGTHTVVTEMKQVRAHLKSLEAQIGDEKAFAKARPDIAPVIKRSLEPLHRDLMDIKDTLNQCSRKPSIHVVDQVRYLVIYKAKLDAFHDKLPAHRASIVAMQELIDSESPRERRESTVRLDGIVEEQEKARGRDIEYEKAQREVVRMFEERFESHSADEMRNLSMGAMLERLEEDLVAKGMERKAAEEAMFPITKALLRQPLPGNVNRETSSQRPQFKLDLFEVKEGSEGGCRGDNTTSGHDLQNEKTTASSDHTDPEETLPKASTQSLLTEEPTSPFSFLTRRRPLLEKRMKSSDLILPRT